MPFLTHRDQVARIAFITAYLLLMLAGATVPLQLVAFQGTPIGEVPFEPVWWTMSFFLGVGGLACGAGAIARRWIGEYVGLPLVFSSLFVFGLLQANINNWSPLVVPSVSLLWALGGFAVTRWRQTMYYYMVARISDMERRSR